MKRWHLVASLGLILLSSALTAEAQTPRASAYEVWVVDQSNTRGLDHGGTLYIFAGRDLPGEASSPLKPAAIVAFSASGQRDSHGMVVTGKGEYIWVMDRHADVVEVLRASDSTHVRSIALNGALTNNAAPDLADASPAGDLVFVALRGPTPLSGDPHNATGSTPGLGILEVTEGGRNGRLRGIVRVTNVGADGVERADPHGLRVRRLN